MYPPVFDRANASAAVKAVLGTNPLRVYMFGMAPQNVQYPYAVWQVVAGAPENYINDLPDIDSFTTQIDVYATSATQARSGAQALRDAFEPYAHIMSWRGDSRDAETGAYRTSFDLDWWADR